MSWLEDWVGGGAARSANKPVLDWVSAYSRSDGSFVDGHWRTRADGDSSNNLNTDVDNDGIAGYFDADANGDGVFEAIDANSDGIADAIDIDGDGILDWLDEMF